MAINRLLVAINRLLERAHFKGRRCERGQSASPLSFSSHYAGCCMRRTEKFSYRKRTFLMPASTGIPSYVLAEVESSNDGEDNCGHYMITIADCHRNIQLEFPLATARSRQHSLAKIELLIEVFIAFGTALQKEAQLIADGKRLTETRRIGKKKI